MNKNPFIDIDREILADSGTSREVEKNLLSLCDDIGPRFAGTDGYRRAADFMLGRYKSYGFENARLEPFPFTAWRRGKKAEFTTVSPRQHTFECYMLPYGAATGSEGIEAELVHIGNGSPDQINAHADDIRGRFVLSPCTGTHRTEVYARCVELGAVGFVFSNSTPGMILATGSAANAEEGKIPAVGIAYETALYIQRLLKEKGKRPRFRLITSGGFEASTTWNVVAELPGTDFPDEPVIMGGHLDSHDIGPCAYDNGAGAVMVLEAARLLTARKRHLKRPIRFINFAAEEIGLLGSRYHASQHAEELRKARFMLNCDMPSLGRPRGLGFHECPKAATYLDALSEQMGMDLVCQNRSHCHSDHYPFILQGLPTAGVAGGKFGPAIQHFYHCAADTPDKISFTDLRDCAAFAARFLIRAANDENWPDMRRTPEEIDKFGK